MAAQSAPGEDEDGLVELGHIFENEEGQQASAAQPASQPVADERAEPPPAGARRGTAADFRLLRSSGALRAQAAAGVIVPFVLYVVVMVVIGRMDRLVLFLWAPILVAGVLFGAVLDQGHRRAGKARG